ncbi:hypothetical protein F5Y00DRAFT_273922 [Daldinia vernicosa]|uniref:uncharacterized protein n=1 Tax=Daldinia vernicosa TaxID=114800 RepID=UPI0020077781|nr:uncharacterized protein F5Y00DRAFT_273922 [Daldinia vernicosa]KAI0844595.1 hypothetical protein F5Y00DRAFT_273922 [Daldinia vernicosa]
METPPFDNEEQLYNRLTDTWISCDAALRLPKELDCPVLDKMYPSLHFFARKSSSHIDPIHEHKVKERRICITEDPALHLVWYYNTIFIKPLSPELLSYDFWEEHLKPSSTCRPAALGFIRSYAYLVRHRSDFIIAREENLIPASETMTYGDFSRFIDKFRDIPDTVVSPRWRFGQLRLSRLNWAVRLLQPQVPGHRGLLQRLFYRERFWQTRYFIQEFAAPLVFVFAAFSLILAAMQVVLAARPDETWPAFVAVSTWFSVIVIIALVAWVTLIVAIMLAIQGWQLSFALLNAH